MGSRNDSGEFICPECGATDAAMTAMVQPIDRSDDPWSGVLQRITCAACRFEIPAHLAERWDGLALEQARQEWKKMYRATARKEKGKRG